MTKKGKRPHIGTLGEKSLHAALKEWYAQPGDRFEVPVENFVVDIVRDDRLIEIQTRHLYHMKRKLKRLLPDYPVTVIYPIARDKWIVRQTAEGEPVSRRKSPKHGQVIHLFSEVVRLPQLLLHPNLSLLVLLTQQEEVLRDDGQGSWRRRHWSVHDQRLLTVLQQVRLETPVDFLNLLPGNLEEPFTNRELASALDCQISLAQRMTYTLRHMGLLSADSKRGNALLHNLTASAISGDRLD